MRKATHAPPGLLLTDHEFELPLDYSRPAAAKIRVFVREGGHAG